MKKILFLIITCLLFQWHHGQETFTVNGESLELKTEIEGEIDLLWNTINKNYRYFVRTANGEITELKNSRGENKKYNEEYKIVLNKLTGKETNKLKLTLSSLRSFIDAYNASADSSYTPIKRESRVGLRLGFSGGATNNPFVGNSENNFAPLLGGELEIFDNRDISRHSGFFQIRHAFKTNKFEYSATELSLGYRFKFIKRSKFSIYGQVKFATLNFTNATIIVSNDMELSISETSFDIPFIFGIGSDIQVGKQSYITFIYGELFAFFLDNQGNFPADFSLGYKFKL